MPARASKTSTNASFGPYGAGDGYTNDELRPGERISPLPRRKSRALLRGVFLLAIFGGGWALLTDRVPWPDWQSLGATASSWMSRIAPSPQPTERASLVIAPPPRSEPPLRPIAFETAPQGLPLSVHGQSGSCSAAAACDGGPRGAAIRAAAAARRPSLRPLSHPRRGRRPASRPVARPARPPLGDRLPQRRHRHPHRARRDARQRRPCLAAPAQARARAVPGPLRAGRGARLPALCRDHHQGRLADHGTAHGEVRRHPGWAWQQEARLSLIGRGRQLSI